MTRLLTPDRLPQGWDATVDAYDRHAVPFTTRYAADALRLAQVKPDERVLDVSAGTGALTLLAARAGARVVATDFAPAMVERLRARLAAEKLDGAVETAVMDGQALDLPEGAFDAAFNVFGLIFFADRAEGLREMRRVLRPGGRAVVASWGPPEKAPFLALMGRAAREAGIDLPAPPGGPAVFSMQDARQVEADMRAAGFHDVEVHRATHTWDVPTPEDFWGSIQGTSPVFTPIVERLGPRVAEVRKTLAEMVRREYGPGPVRIPGEALLTLGRA